MGEPMSAEELPEDAPLVGHTGEVPVDLRRGEKLPSAVVGWSWEGRRGHWLTPDLWPWGYMTPEDDERVAARERAARAARAEERGLTGKTDPRTGLPPGTTFHKDHPLQRLPPPRPPVATPPGELPPGFRIE